MHMIREWNGNMHIECRHRWFIRWKIARIGDTILDDLVPRPFIYLR